MHYFDKEKQIDLIKRYKKTGDQHALDLLVRSNEKLVISIARKIKSSNNEIDLDDLIQEGFIGMLDAVRKFDEDRGANFSTFAAYSIRNRVGKFLMSNKSILKFSTSNDGRSLFQKHPVISRKLDSEDITEEQKCRRISEELKIDLETVRAFRQSIGRGSLSLDAKVSSDGSSDSFISGISSDDDVEFSAMETDFVSKIVSVVGEMMKSDLSDLENIILEKKYLGEESLTLSAISDIAGVSVQHISATEKRMLQKIKSRVIFSLKE